ncbi:MAG: response regulator [Rhodospirillaceae bacterium]|nr:response regulator [Rhodospirillaceae bacterium]
MSVPLVLVVEDTGPGARLMAELVGLAGGRAVIAETGAEALEAACAEVPDLVIMDLCLPDGDGGGWARRIRSLPGLADVPVWACSGMPTDAVLNAAWDETPFSGWIGKPFDVSEILVRLRTVLCRP